MSQSPVWLKEGGTGGKGIMKKAFGVVSIYKRRRERPMKAASVQWPLS